ncbi:MAG: hypothetical protein FJW38_23440 [Acidobacteria bacterium]|nr:hypothetical protein [Acidobacteriota bacterium]
MIRLFLFATALYAAGPEDAVRAAAEGWTHAAVKQDKAGLEKFLAGDLQIRFYGSAAVLTGYVDVKLAGQNAFRVRTLQVYTSNGANWQMAAHQSTRITQR